VIATLEGQGDTVRALVYSPDSRLLASGDQDGIIHLWDVSSRRSLGILLASRLPVTSVQFSHDGRTIAAATIDESQSSPGAGTFWEVATRRKVGVLAGTERGVAAIAVSPDGRMIATAASEGVIQLWDRATGSLQNSVKYSGCHSVAFSADGRFLASGHDGGDVVVWDTHAGRQVALLKGHRDAVTRVVFAPDGRLLATTGKDRTVKLWSLTTRRQTARAHSRET
jgi:WD40 repeat protein